MAITCAATTTVCTVTTGPKSLSGSMAMARAASCGFHMCRGVIPNPTTINSPRRTSKLPGVSCRNVFSASPVSAFKASEAQIISKRLLSCFKKPQAIIHGLGNTENGEGEDESRDGLAEAFLNISPAVAIKWTTIAALALTTGRAFYKVFFSPAIWTYVSWLFVVWPMPAALAIGMCSIYVTLPRDYLKTRKSKKAKQRDQILALGGALTWLILVPLGFRNGYLEGWPFTLFLAYMYFFLIPAIIQLRRYGEFNMRTESKKWSSSLSKAAQTAFVAAVAVGHWAAAFEGPILYFSWNWQWASRIAAAVIFLAITLQYSSTYFLDKYFNRSEKPIGLVIFGPYRLVRHPIYTSYMVLFAGFCLALRAYWSMAFLVLASLFYYEQRAKLEEDMLVEEFGEREYNAYRDKVKYKFFPFLY